MTWMADSVMWPLTMIVRAGPASEAGGQSRIADSQHEVPKHQGFQAHQLGHKFGLLTAGCSMGNSLPGTLPQRAQPL